MSSKSQYSSDYNKIYQCLSRFNVSDNIEKVYYRMNRTKKTNITVNNNVSIRRKMKQVQTCEPTTLIPLINEVPLSPKSSNNDIDYHVVTTSSYAATINTIGPATIEDEIQPTNIVILKISEFEKIKTGKYSLNELRILCSHYGIKKSGTKTDLVTRIYTHLKQSCLIVKIQRKFRNYIAVQYRKINGPAFLNPKVCVNDTDFYTFDTLTDIEPHKLFSFKDDDGKIYGFHIASIYNLIISSFPDITNPYNRNIIPLKVIQNVYDKLIYGTLLNIKVSIKLDEDGDEEVPVKISPEKQEELFIVGLFQHINTLGNYSDSEWFMTLRRNDYLIIRI